jgi:benzoyl-CoA 2,3-dioxygenase component A
MALVRQHLIDPEICIRCNTCEEICPVKAITHDHANYVVDFDKCNFCGDCYPPCPTGAIDSHRMVLRPWSVADQYAWSELPADREADGLAPIADMPVAKPAEIPADVARITAIAGAGAGGREVPPWSAAHPYVNLYPPERAAKATIAGNFRLTAEDSDVDIRHIVLDFGTTPFPVLEGQSIGIRPPGNDPSGRPHHVRLYSVASPRDGERPGYNNLALTIKRITEDERGRPVHGVASNYLCDLEKGAEVKITGPFGATFLMPNEPEARIVMICTGTGSAPFRAMTERRRRQVRRHGAGAGSLHLFFGARLASELPYFGPLMRLPSSLIDVELAFSREPDRPKEYVQDRLRARAADVATLLRDERAYVFICGHKRMETGVHLALGDICRAHGMTWEQLLPELRNAGRFHVETYS